MLNTRKFFKIITSIVIYANILIFHSAFAQGYMADRIVATVNDEVITDSDLTLYSKMMLFQIPPEQRKTINIDSLKAQFLQQMIYQKLQLQFAKKFDINAKESDIETGLDNLAAINHVNKSVFIKQVESSGVKFADYKAHLKDEFTADLLRKEVIYPDIKISDKEVENYVNTALAYNQTGIEYRLGHILIALSDNAKKSDVQAATAKAQNIMQQLKNGQDFQQLAIKYSDGALALKGGDLGFRPINQIPTIFVKTVPNLQINQVEGPIHTASGIHIIKLLEKKVSGGKIYKEYQVRQILLKPKNQRTDAQAQGLLKLLADKIRTQKSNFKTLAAEYSEETSTAAVGGEMGWIQADNMLPAFSSQVQQLKAGELSEPFKTELGWHLIELTAERTQNSSKEAFKNKAFEILREQKFYELAEIWLRQLKESAAVNIML